MRLQILIQFGGLNSMQIKKLNNKASRSFLTNKFILKSLTDISFVALARPLLNFPALFLFCLRLLKRSCTARDVHILNFESMQAGNSDQENVDNPMDIDNVDNAPLRELISSSAKKRKR